MNQRDRAEWVKQDYDLIREQKTSGLSMSRWLKLNRERVDAAIKKSMKPFDPCEPSPGVKVYHGPGTIGA
jgi:hypothetical protein